MPNSMSHRLFVDGPKGERNEVPCAITTPPFFERLTKGGKLGLIIFAGTLASAFIPILHFVTVPVGLLLSGFFLFRALTKSRQISTDSFSCPSCAKSTDPINIIVATETFYTNCSACGILLSVHIELS